MPQEDDLDIAIQKLPARSPQAALKELARAVPSFGSQPCEVILHMRTGARITGELVTLQEGALDENVLLRSGGRGGEDLTLVYAPIAEVAAIEVARAQKYLQPLSFGRLLRPPVREVPTKLDIARRIEKLKESLRAVLPADRLTIGVPWGEAAEDETARIDLGLFIQGLSDAVHRLTGDPLAADLLKQKLNGIRIELAPTAYRWDGAVLVLGFPCDGKEPIPSAEALAAEVGKLL
jgi:hypothetical protein